MSSSTKSECEHRLEPRDLHSSNLHSFFAGDDVKVLLLDYDGTLRQFENDPDQAIPGPELIELLSSLNKRQDIRVVIISGRVSAFLDAHLGQFENFTLVAEHGHQIRQPCRQQWESTSLTPSNQQSARGSWRHIVLNALSNVQADLVQGTFTEEKNKSMVWHYRTAAPHEGSNGAAALIKELLLNQYPQDRIVHGNKMVEMFGPRLASKGAAMYDLLTEFKICEPSLRTVLCAGDDVTDESMFSVTDADLDILSVKIGEGQTSALFRAPTPESFLQFLREI